MSRLTDDLRAAQNGKGMCMNAVELIQHLHRHRAWVNGNLLTAAAEYVWLEALLGNEEFIVPGDLPGKLPGNQQGEAGVTDLADLRLKWSELEEWWTGYLARLSSAALEEVVYRKSASLGNRLGVRRSDILLHVCTHAHYTAAQVVNMLRQTGVEKLPETMLISLARHEAT